MKQNQKHKLIVLLCLVTLVALCLTFAACNKTYSVKIANYDKAQGSVTLSPESQDGQYKEGTELTVTVKPVDGYAVESFKLGSEEKVGELNSEGKFVFKVQQDTTITVTFKSTTVAVESVSLNKQSLSVHVTKQDASLTAHVLPENATDKTVTWTSSVPAVATVDNDGKITAVAAGETVITATAGDGKTATCTVTVTDHQLTTVSAGENGHKSVCGVDGCGYESEVSAHSLKINSDKTKFECEQCEYEENHTHDIKVESAGESGHKNVCQTEGCGYEGEVSAHSLKINSDKTKFECEQCEYEENHTHDIKVESAGENGHKSVCKTDGCGYESAVSAHSLKINSDKTKFECEQCEYEVAHSHVLETKSAGESGHKEVCKTEGCGYEGEVSAHSLKINSDKTKFECEQCDYEVAHSHDLETKSAGESGHKSVCKTDGCGYESAVTAHSLKINSDKTKFECEQCEYEVAHTHDIKVESAGASGHKSVCQTEGCGYESAVSAHSLKINSDKTKFECEQCEYEVAHSHDLETKSAGANGHKSVCKTDGCGYESAVSAHSLKINSDKTKFECEQCEYEENHTHDIKVESAGVSGHKSVCQTEGCGYEGEVSAHSLKINSDKTKFECEQCEYEVAHSHVLETKSAGESGHKEVCKTEGCGYEGEVKSHNLDPEYASDGDQGHHTNCLDCDYVTETVAHVNSSGVYENAGNGGHTYRCDICEALVKEQHNRRTDYSRPDGEYQVCDANGCTYEGKFRDHDLKLVYDADSHHEECQNSNCTYKTDPIKCEESGQVVYTADSVAPESGHRGKCVCGNELALEAHDQNGPSGTCTKCGYSGTHTHIDEPDANGYKDGLCDTDGMQLTDPIWAIGVDGVITAFNGDETYTKLIVPTTIDSIKVTSVGKALQKKTNLTHVIVPSGIEAATKSNQTFSGCTNLQSVIILGLPASADIGANAFKDCASLKEIVLPANVTGFNKNAFGTTPSSQLDITIYFMGTSEQWSSIVSTVQIPCSTVLQGSTVLFFGVDDSGWHWQIDNVVPVAGKKE